MYAEFRDPCRRRTLRVSTDGRRELCLSISADRGEIPIDPIIMSLDHAQAAMLEDVLTTLRRNEMEG